MQTNKLKKAILAGGILFSAVAVNPIGSIPFANVPAEAYAAASETVQPRADVIYYVYRECAGWLQKRRWNQTRGYWVDPKWINVEYIGYD